MTPKKSHRPHSCRVLRRGRQTLAHWHTGTQTRTAIEPWRFLVCQGLSREPLPRSRPSSPGRTSFVCLPKHKPLPARHRSVSSDSFRRPQCPGSPWPACLPACLRGGGRGAPGKGVDGEAHEQRFKIAPPRQRPFTSESRMPARLRRSASAPGSKRIPLTTTMPFLENCPWPSTTWPCAGGG